jgi:hypothetical protein
MESLGGSVIARQAEQGPLLFLVSCPCAVTDMLTEIEQSVAPGHV